MPAGKLCSQAGHAFTGAFHEALKTSPDLIAAYLADGGIGTKICLVAPDLDALLAAHHKADQGGVPHALITDERHVLPPHFTGAPVITALGIGPARRAEVSAITRKFKLL